MKPSSFCFAIAACLPVVLHAGETVTKIQELLHPCLLLKEFTVSAPSDIKESQSKTWMLEFFGGLKNKYGVFILSPAEAKWAMSGYAYFRVDITNHGKGLIWIRSRLDNEGAVDWAHKNNSMAYILPGESPQLDASGFFRVEKYKGRWWLWILMASYSSTTGRIPLDLGNQPPGKIEKNFSRGCSPILTWVGQPSLHPMESPSNPTSL